MHRTAILKLLLVVSAVFFSAESRACSIPVFRYALERWTPDLYEVDVFYRGSLTTGDRQAIESLEEQAIANGGRANLEVVRCDVEGPLPPDLSQLAAELADTTLPQVVVRLPLPDRSRALVWRGPLAELSVAALTDSPARRELSKRLLGGDSVVWLLIGDAEHQSIQTARQTLETLLPKLAEETPLPPGVGAPGSELASRVPLAVRFSMLTIDSSKKEEFWLQSMLAAQAPPDGQPGEPLVAAVFGRGRVVEVFYAVELDEQLVADVSRFLCGACSCQVKQLNPGFDLLTSTMWDEQLFGEGESPAIASDPIGAAIDPNNAPTLVAIPPGAVEASKLDDETVDSQEQTTSAATRTTLAFDAYRWPVLGVAAATLVLLGLVWMLRRSIQT